MKTQLLPDSQRAAPPSIQPSAETVDTCERKFQKWNNCHVLKMSNQVILHIRTVTGLIVVTYFLCWCHIREPQPCRSHTWLVFLERLPAEQTGWITFCPHLQLHLAPHPTDISEDIYDKSEISLWLCVASLTDERASLPGATGSSNKSWICQSSKNNVDITCMAHIVSVALPVIPLVFLF